MGAVPIICHLTGVNSLKVLTANTKLASNHIFIQVYPATVLSLRQSTKTAGTSEQRSIGDSAKIEV